MESKSKIHESYLGFLQNSLPLDFGMHECPQPLNKKKIM